LDAATLAAEMKARCIQYGGAATVPQTIQSTLKRVANILNINWVSRSMSKPAQLICARGGSCPRAPACYQCISE